MKTIKGTQTEKNVLKAFSGESQARNRYTFFAGAAKKEGYRQISEIFEQTAAQEKEHAQRLFKFLEGGELEITSSYPAGIIGDTAANLKEAAAGEDHEWQQMYPDFAKTARQEGFEEIASVMEHIAIAEKHHSARYKALLQNVQDGSVFKKPQDAAWQCLNCGYTLEGKEAPVKCPACNHPTMHFALLNEKY
jgi:rubrerythrin